MTTWCLHSGISSQLQEIGYLGCTGRDERRGGTQMAAYTQAVEPTGHVHLASRSCELEFPPARLSPPPLVDVPGSLRVHLNKMEWASPRFKRRIGSVYARSSMFVHAYCHFMSMEVHTSEVHLISIECHWNANRISAAR